MGLTGLQGLTYPIRGLREDSPVSAATYADSRRFELQPGGGVSQVVEPDGRAPLDFVLASSAVDVRSRMPDPVGRGLDRVRAALRHDS